MTRTFLIAALLVMSIPSFGSAHPHKDDANPQSGLANKKAQLLLADANYVIVIAHRACWRDGAPENGLGAVQACISMDVDMIEIDVRSTKDGRLVLMHDDTVDRTTNGSGLVSAMTFNEIRKLRLKAGAGGEGSALTDEIVPTFEEVMLAAKGKVLVNLDAKADVYRAAFEVLNTTGTSDHIVMKRRVNLKDPVLKSESPFDRVFAMPILDQQEGDPTAIIAKQSTQGPNVAFELIFNELGYLDKARGHIESLGARIWVNSLQPTHAAGITDAKAMGNPDENWGRLIANGVDMIQTDEPRTLISYLEAQGRRNPRK